MIIYLGRPLDLGGSVLCPWTVQSSQVGLWKDDGSGDDERLGKGGDHQEFFWCEAG